MPRDRRARTLDVPILVSSTVDSVCVVINPESFVRRVVAARGPVREVAFQ